MERKSSAMRFSAAKGNAGASMKNVRVSARKRQKRAAFRATGGVKAAQPTGKAGWNQGSMPGGFSIMKTLNPSGQADVELDKLYYETTSAFTATGGASSYLQIKGNSIYRPYPGNTDSCGGYQRMYTQYRQSYAEASAVEVRVWSATGTASQEPFRLLLIPCTSEQYTVYSGYTNIAALVDVPHAKQTLFSPGGTLPKLRAKAPTVGVLAGVARDDGTLAQQNSNFWGTSGADPSPLWYWLIGLQSMAGTTTLNCQIQVKITYWLRWRQPIATAVQQLMRNKWGNEEVPSAEEQKSRQLQETKALMESKEIKDLGFRSTEIKSTQATVDGGQTVKPLPKDDRRGSGQWSWSDEDLPEDGPPVPGASVQKFREWMRQSVRQTSLKDKLAGLTEAEVAELADFSGGLGLPGRKR